MTPNPFDQGSRYLARLAPVSFLHWLLPRLDPACIFQSWRDTRTVPFPGERDRVCDTVAELTNGVLWWALPIEFQATPDESMFGRMLEYLGRLWQTLRLPGSAEQRYIMAAAVINLTGRGKTSRNMRLPGTNVCTRLQVAERNLATERATTTLTAVAAGRVGRWVLAWIPLMQGGAKAATITRWKELAEAEPDRRRRADYAGLALVFSELAECWPEWKAALEGWNVQQSQQVLEWQEEARQQARTEGRAQGRAEGRTEALEQLLRIRFGSSVPEAVWQRIRGTSDLAQLDRWFSAAAQAMSLEEFCRLLTS